MCVPGVNREAIKYFITKTIQEGKVGQAVLAMDATDINPCVRLVYMGGLYEVVGGVALGSLAGELGLSEVDDLQRELNDHAASPRVPSFQTTSPHRQGESRCC